MSAMWVRCCEHLDSSAKSGQELALIIGRLLAIAEMGVTSCDRKFAEDTEKASTESVA